MICDLECFISSNICFFNLLLALQRIISSLSALLILLDGRSAGRKVNATLAEELLKIKDFCLQFLNQSAHLLW